MLLIPGIRECLCKFSVRQCRNVAFSILMLVSHRETLKLSSYATEAFEFLHRIFMVERKDCSSLEVALVFHILAMLDLAHSDFVDVVQS